MAKQLNYLKEVEQENRQLLFNYTSAKEKLDLFVVQEEKYKGVCKQLEQMHVINDKVAIVEAENAVLRQKLAKWQVLYSEIKVLVSI